MNLLKRWREDGGEEQATTRPGAMETAERGLSRLRREIEGTFGRLWRELDRRRGGEARLPSFRELGEWPALDMGEDDKQITLRVDVPGLEPKDLDLQVSGNLLSIRGTRADEFTENRGGVYRRERRSGSFLRTVTLPSYVDTDKLEARYDKGILTINVPKVPGKGPKRVEVGT